MEILTSVRRLYVSFKSLVNDFVYSFGRAALLLLVGVWNHTVPIRERRRIRDTVHIGKHTVQKGIYTVYILYILYIYSTLYSSGTVMHCIG